MINRDNRQAEKDRFERSRQALRIGVLGGLAFAGSCQAAEALSADGNVQGCYYGVMVDNPNLPLYSFTSTDPDMVSISYQADVVTDNTPDVPGCGVAWKLDYTYTTSGGVGPFTSSESFNGHTSSAVSHASVNKGGSVSITATPSVSYPIPGYGGTDVAGTQIANGDITSELTTLYSNDHSGLNGYTPDLLCHIAVQESGYAQFSNETLYGQAADWPTENGAAGSVSAGKYIGLLQVPVSMANAFDWKQNGQSGNNILNSKLGNVISYEMSQQSAMTGLPSMTAEQVEDSALVSYGGFANRNANCKVISGRLRLYIPVNDMWTLNPAANCVSAQGNTAEQYVNGVRNDAIPS